MSRGNENGAITTRAMRSAGLKPAIVGQPALHSHHQPALAIDFTAIQMR
jgi:hypothetical protein